MQTIAILGYGNIAQALSPLLRTWRPDAAIVAIDQDMDDHRRAIAAEHGFQAVSARIDQHSLQDVVGPLCGRGTLVLNLATSIDSLVCMAWAQSRGAFYLDTCIDPWAYDDGRLDDAANTNYAMRQKVIDLRDRQRATGKSFTTAVCAHGANPGFVSILVKQALLDMRETFLPDAPMPSDRSSWARLSEALGIRCVQISERDHQTGNIRRAHGEFLNTWSADGFVAEALQPAELGWGSHEAAGPMAAMARHHEAGERCAVHFPILGVQARVTSWAPMAGTFTGRLISHNEAISLASLLTRADDDGQVRYRPTVYYAYRPCDMAEESLGLIEGGNRRAITTSRVLKNELETGVDELGVLLLSDRHPALWLGSHLSVERARQIAPHNNATSLQVVGSIMAALAWIEANPAAGIVESEDLDHAFIFEKARASWEPIVRVHQSWHPKGASGPGTRWTLDQFLA